MVLVSWALRPSMVSVTMEMRRTIGQRRRQRAEPVVDGFGYRLRARIEGLFERFETAIDGFVEGSDLAVERSIEVGDAGLERGLELQQTLIERGGDLAAIRGQSGVEGIDIGFQVIGNILRALPHALDDFAAEGFDGAIEFRDVAGNESPERA